MSRRVLLAAAALPVGAAVANAAPSVTAISAVRLRVTPRLAGQGSAAHVALTFDDGPDPASTPAFLTALAAAGVRATFFLLGARAQRYRALAGEIHAAGHELAVHGWSHRCALLQTPAGTRESIRRSVDVLADITGVAPQHYRPSYGILTSAAYAAAAERGLRTRLWTVAGGEWRHGSTPDTVLVALRAGLRPGATVLLHDSDCTSPPGSAGAALSALPGLLATCQQRTLPVGALRDRVEPLTARRRTTSPVG